MTTYNENALETAAVATPSAELAPQKPPTSVATFEFLLEEYRAQARLLDQMYWRTIEARMAASKDLKEAGTVYEMEYPYKHVSEAI